MCLTIFLFFKQKSAYEMRISDWSSDVCSSDLPCLEMVEIGARRFRARIPGPMSTALPRASLPRPRVGVEEARLSWRVGVARNLRQLGPHAVEHGDDGPCRSEVGVLVYDLKRGMLDPAASLAIAFLPEIGRASCRERVCKYV